MSYLRGGALRGEHLIFSYTYKLLPWPKVSSLFLPYQTAIWILLNSPFVLFEFVVNFQVIYFFEKHHTAAMASQFEEKETRSPTPETLVEDPRNVYNVTEKTLESAEGSIGEGQTVGKVDEPAKGEEAVVEGEDEIEYASGFKLGFIVIALALSIFLVCRFFHLRNTIVYEVVTHTWYRSH
jgi:hypothetical protein